MVIQILTTKKEDGKKTFANFSNNLNFSFFVGLLNEV